VNSHTIRSAAQGTIAAVLYGLTTLEMAVFKEGLQRAIQLQGVCDSCSDLTLGEPV
jgi:hypothetical protein